jgi:hypothetical protein
LSQSFREVVMLRQLLVAQQMALMQQVLPIAP